MKKNITTLILVFSTIVSFAQIDIETILEGGVDDAETFLKGYLQPAPTGFGYGMNGGWYTTARPHKMFGFDVRVIATASLVPTSSETFTFNNADYDNIKLDDSSLSSDQLPTIFGSQKLEDRPLLEFSSNGNTISSSTLPGSGIKDAIGYNIVPSAMVQVGLGIFKNTDIKFRFIPKQSQPEYEFSTLGFGIMHDLKQWIPFVKRLPIDVSAIVAWNDVKSKFILNSDQPSSDQAFEFNTKTFMFQIIASKKIAFFTLFGGLGTSSYNSDVNLLGTYSTSQTNTTYTDPIKMNYKGSSFRGNVGLNMKLLFLNLSADYAVQEFNTFTVTAGFSIR